MSGHIYRDCKGGRLLTTLGATWFVSYLYYLTIDPTHLNWKKFEGRKSNFYKSQKYHAEWLKKIANKNPLNLNKNQIDIEGVKVKEMAKELLKIIEEE